MQTVVSAAVRALHEQPEPADANPIGARDKEKWLRGENLTELVRRTQE